MSQVKSPSPLNLVRPERFEPPTPAFGGQYSIQLSYGRIRREILPFAPRRVHANDTSYAV